MLMIFYMHGVSPQSFSEFQALVDVSVSPLSLLINALSNNLQSTIKNAQVKLMQLHTSFRSARDHARQRQQSGAPETMHGHKMKFV